MFLRAAAAAVAAAMALACSRQSPKTADTDVVVAEIDGARVTLKDLKTEIAELRGLGAGGDAARATGGEVSRAMRRLVERAVVLREGERQGVTVSGKEVEEAVRRFGADFPPGGLEKALMQAGIDKEEWRSNLKRNLLYRKSAAAIAAARAEVGEDEVREAFRKRKSALARPERIRVVQFLFETEGEALEARPLVLSGLAPDEVERRAASDDAVPAAVDLGLVTREDLPAELSGVLFALEEGGVSGVIRREKSFSLFRVERKEPARTLDFAAAAPEIREELLAARREEAFGRWLGGALAAADVRVQDRILAKLSEGTP